MYYNVMYMYMYMYMTNFEYLILTRSTFRLHGRHWELFVFYQSTKHGLITRKKPMNFVHTRLSANHNEEYKLQMAM